MITVKGSPSRYMSFYISIAVFFYLATTVSTRGAYSYGIVMLWLAGLGIFFTQSRPKLSAQDVLVLSVYMGYFFTHYTVNLYHHDILREYDLPLRFLLAVPILWLFKKCPIYSPAVWGGLAIGAISGFFVILWQLILIRSSGSSAPPFIHLGNISMIIGLMCFAGWRWAIARERHRFLWLGLIILGGIAGMAASVLTGTRGAWLAVPIVLVIYLFDLAYFFRWSAVKVAGYALMALLLIAITGYQNPIIKSRYDLAVNETQLFFNPTPESRQKAEDTSVGQRWLMWSNALYMIQIKPWLGWGKKGYLDFKNERILNGEVLPQIAKYTDAHNDYLDALAKRGLFGLLSLLALFILPFILFTKILVNGSFEQRSFALSGVVMIIGYAISGLTCTFMTINMDVMFYSITTLVLWGFIAGGNPSDTSIPQLRAS